MKFLVSSTERQEVWSPHCISNEAINQYSLQKITPGWLAARRKKNVFRPSDDFLLYFVVSRVRRGILSPHPATQHNIPDGQYFDQMWELSRVDNEKCQIFSLRQKHKHFLYFTKVKLWLNFLDSCVKRDI